MIRYRLSLMVMVVVMLAACSQPSDTPPPTDAAATNPPTAAPTEQEATAPPATENPPTDAPDASLPDTIGLELVAEGFAAPVDLEQTADGRLFVVDQTGTITVITPDGTVMDTPFLDVRDRMVTLNQNYDERGLLGMAFHPDFTENNRFFIYYSAPEAMTDVTLGGPFSFVSRVSEWQVTEMGNVDPDSERVLLEIPQPQNNHNAGDISFGPDGYLYIPLGDGGSADDTGAGHAADWYTTNDGGNGQDIAENRLGSILRIDVDSGDPYAIPDDNPILGDNSAPTEEWAFGFRNPWGATWDSATGDYYVADVGQNLWEEVNIVESGGNYGWNVYEGTHCFSTANPTTSPATCPTEDTWGNPLRMPVIEFASSNQEGGLGLSVVGGYVYRGSRIPGLEGAYVFGQWSTSFRDPLGSLLVAQPGDWPITPLEVTGRDGLGEFLLGFGQGTDGDLYVLTDETPSPFGDSGKVYRIVE